MTAPAEDFTVRNLSCPMTVMHFHLVYSGPLPASGNSPKPADVCVIRDAFHPQLKLLWETHTALKRLRWTARVPKQAGAYFTSGDSPFYESDDEPPPFVAVRPGSPEMADLCEPISKGGKTYHPLVRRSLDLNCSVNIHFLRQEDPGSLVLQGGDLDGRIKTLFDALRVPDADVEAKYPQAQDSTYCLLESDTLISGFEVASGRLLTPKTTHPHEVHLLIEVTIRVLRLGPWNVCLAGG